MRKAVLHIVFLLALVSTTTSHAFAIVNDVPPPTNIEKAIIESSNKAKQSSGDNLFLKNDVVTDVEDYDEFDFDEHDSGLRERLCTPIPEFKINLLAIDTNNNVIGKPLYTHANFSRLPRYNYITLRVFRI